MRNRNFDWKTQMEQLQNEKFISNLKQINDETILRDNSIEEIYEL